MMEKKFLEDCIYKVMRMKEKVVIILGSSNDEEFAKPIWTILGKYKIPYERRVISAHKRPEDLLKILKEYENSEDKIVYITFKDHIMKFVLEQDCVPLNPFVFGYFLLDTVPRDLIREANNNLIKRADEVWVFGKISDGVLAEIKLARQMKKPIRFFKVIESKEIKEISKEEIEFENNVKELL